MNSQPEFYVGYLPIPSGLKRSARRIVAAAGVIAAVVAIVLVLEQRPFAASAFEYRQYRDFEGRLVTRPYPMLLGADGTSWLLVAPGKHGFAPSARDGTVVRLRGERIYRGDDRMLEVLPGSMQTIAAGAAAPAEPDLGLVQLMGEIVDSKCYFGVMNPGNGKVHRDCAARCIAGGIPPAFLVRDAEGRASTFLLANWRREWLDHVAEPVLLRGRIARSGGRLVFYPE
jgi:hypothetical protein